MSHACNRGQSFDDPRDDDPTPYEHEPWDERIDREDRIERWFVIIVTAVAVPLALNQFVQMLWRLMQIAGIGH